MEENQVQGWKDVQLTADMPLSALIQFLNILNQRLCAVEDNTFVRDDNNKMISLTELYYQQTIAEAQAAAQEQEEQGE